MGVTRLEDIGVVFSAALSEELPKRGLWLKSMTIQWTSSNIPEIAIGVYVSKDGETAQRRNRYRRPALDGWRTEELEAIAANYADHLNRVLTHSEKYLEMTFYQGSEWIREEDMT